MCADRRKTRCGRGCEREEIGGVRGGSDRQTDRHVGGHGETEVDRRVDRQREGERRGEREGRRESSSRGRGSGAVQVQGAMTWGELIAFLSIILCPSRPSAAPRVQKTHY